MIWSLLTLPERLPETPKGMARVLSRALMPCDPVGQQPLGYPLDGSQDYTLGECRPFPAFTRPLMFCLISISFSGWNKVRIMLCDG